MGILLSELASLPEATDAGSVVSKDISDYGFLVVFAGSMIVIVVLFFIWLFSMNKKKSDKEMDILAKERSASIEQGQQMFKLVTEVQTQQITQLQQMTESLKELRNSATNTDREMANISSNFEQVRTSILDCDANHRHIRQALDDVLECVRTSRELNNTILDKVNTIEEGLASIANSQEKKPLQKPNPKTTQPKKKKEN